MGDILKPFKYKLKIPDAHPGGRETSGCRFHTQERPPTFGGNLGRDVANAHLSLLGSRKFEAILDKVRNGRTIHASGKTRSVVDVIKLFWRKSILPPKLKQ